MGGCRPGAGAPRRPLCSAAVWGLVPLTWAPKLQQMQKSHPPSIQVFHMQKLPARSPPPTSAPTPPLPHSPRSVVLKTGHQSSLSPAQVLLSCQYLLVTSHCHRQLVSSNLRFPSPTQPVLPNPPGLGPPPCEAAGCPALSGEAGWASSCPRRCWEGAASSAHVRGCRVPPHHTEGRPHSTLPLCPGQPWKP